MLVISEVLGSLNQRVKRKTSIVSYKLGFGIIKSNGWKGGNFLCSKFCGPMNEVWLNRTTCGRYYFV